MSQRPRARLGHIKHKTPPGCITITDTPLKSTWVTGIHMHTYLTFIELLNTQSGTHAYTALLPVQLF